MNGTRVVEVVDQLERIVEELHHNIQQESDRSTVFANIRDMRSSIGTLEQEVRGDWDAVKGDAC